MVVLNLKRNAAIFLPFTAARYANQANQVKQVKQVLYVEKRVKQVKQRKHIRQVKQVKPVEQANQVKQLKQIKQVKHIVGNTVVIAGHHVLNICLISQPGELWWLAQCVELLVLII